MCEMKIKYLKCTDCKAVTTLKESVCEEQTTEIRNVDNETFETIDIDDVLTCWNCGGTDFYAVVEYE